MKKLLRVSMISGCLLLFLVGCLLPDSGEESGTIIDIIEAPDPNSFVCNPMDGGDTTLPKGQGVRGTLYYLTDDMPRYKRAVDYVNHGVEVSDVAIYFNQLYIPTRPFDRGFETYSGQLIQTLNGDTLYEYFGFRLEGRLQLAPDQPAGYYQFALLSDDGTTLEVDLGDGYVNIVENDGDHPTRFGCGASIYMDGNTVLPYRIDYYQGPRYHIALVPMMRLLPDGHDGSDPQCGKQGNSMYFNSNNNPPTPTSTYFGLLDRGWEALTPWNYLLPEWDGENPCNEPAPLIMDFRVLSVTSNSITIAWETDIPSTTRGLYRLASEEDFTEMELDNTFKISHQVVISGLSSNTDYVVKGRSKSTSGLSSESGTLSVRTRR